MRPRYRFPGKIEDVSLQFFGRFTWKDILRICLPVGLVELIFSNPYFLPIGLVLGLIWYGFRPFNHSLDHHVYHFIRFNVWRRFE